MRNEIEYRFLKDNYINATTILGTINRMFLECTDDKGYFRFLGLTHGLYVSGSISFDTKLMLDESAIEFRYGSVHYMTFREILDLAS